MSHGHSDLYVTRALTSAEIVSFEMILMNGI
jgi:hypothetical protein